MLALGRDSRGAWRAALACMAALAVAMGLGRFAYTPLLPVMLHEARFDLQDGALLASLNYLGYFLGALSCAAIHWRAPRMVRVGLVATVLLLLGMGLPYGFAWWAVLRTAAGIVSAWTFVFASGWGLRRLAETGAPKLAGLIYAGPGIGITVTGLLGGPADRWGSSAAWFGFGLLALVIVTLIWCVFDDPHPVAVAAPPAPAMAVQGRRGDVFWLIGLYGLAGFGYIITATFLPVIARQALPGSSWPDLFWPLFGLAAIPGALIGARAPPGWDNRLLLAITYTLQALGVVLTVLWPDIVGFMFGSLLLGMPFTAITLFAMREVRRLRGNAAAALIGYTTASYGIGQIVGPLIAAPLARRTGSFAASLLVAAAALAVGALLFVWVWHRRERGEGEK